MLRSLDNQFLYSHVRSNSYHKKKKKNRQTRVPQPTYLQGKTLRPRSTMSSPAKQRSLSRRSLRTASAPIPFRPDNWWDCGASRAINSTSKQRSPLPRNSSTNDYLTKPPAPRPGTSQVCSEWIGAEGSPVGRSGAGCVISNLG